MSFHWNGLTILPSDSKVRTASYTVSKRSNGSNFAVITFHEVPLEIKQTTEEIVIETSSSFNEDLLLLFL